MGALSVTRKIGTFSPVSGSIARSSISGPPSSRSGLLDGVLDGGDRFAVRLGRGDGASEHEHGGVVDDITRAPGAAAGGLELEEVHLPDPVAAGGQLHQRLAAPGGEIAPLAT